MCGIIGYTGYSEARGILLKGLVFQRHFFPGKQEGNKDGYAYWF